MPEAPEAKDLIRTLKTAVLNPGQNLVLRPTELDDAESFFKLVADNYDRLSEWLNVPRPLKTVEERRRLMDADLESGSSGTSHWWLIEADGELAGTIALHHIEPAERSALVGYWLARGFTGRGIMTESLRVVVGWAFSELGLGRVEIRSSIENRASCAIPERLGIRRESIRRQSEMINGANHDMASYVAFADNWPSAPPE